MVFLNKDFWKAKKDIKKLKGKPNYAIKYKNRRCTDILESITCLDDIRNKASAFSNAKGTKSDHQITNTRDLQVQHIHIKQEAAAPPKGKDTSMCHSPVNKAVKSSMYKSFAPVVCHKPQAYVQVKGPFRSCPGSAVSRETCKEVRTQIIRYVAQMEEAHRELAHAMARVGLMEVIEELASVPFQQYKAKVAQLVGVTQSNGSRMGVPKQEEAPNTSRESGRKAMQADTAKHPNKLKQQHTSKIAVHHKELASAKNSRDTELRVNSLRQVERATNM